MPESELRHWPPGMNGQPFMPPFFLQAGAGEAGLVRGASYTDQSSL
jgi:hypothetical protein